MTALATPPTATPVPPPRASRRWPVGAEATGDQATHFRLWAPGRRKVELVLEGPGRPVELKPEGNGYFSRLIEVGPGTRYRYRLNGDGPLCPDPASRFQPEGPFGPSEVIDPRSFPWTDGGWRGVNPRHGVVYELHVGTFTPGGTWRAALEQLPRLADLGVNVLEVMPVADFPGRFGWGYDGVNLFAPTRLYGRPDDFRAFVDRAHGLGLGVILDVVYNHVGPDGNFLGHVSPSYFSTKHKTEWGEAINFDGENSGPVREFFLTNAAYWIDEFHLDGLRLDATQSIFDDGGDHILAGITRATRAAAGKRSIVLIAENEPQHTHLARPAEHGGHGLDMLWNDDFHHSARVALTGRREAYYSDHRGAPQEFVSAAKYGYLFQGQHYTWQKKGRGTPGLDLPPWAFVNFLDNHDQVANSGLGLRCHALTSPGRYRAMTALLLLAPGTPMLFQGQEFASSSPFHYFADHKPELAELVARGRGEFLEQFPSLARRDKRPALPAPHDEATFARCRLDPAEAERNAWAVELHRDLLRLRRDDPTFSHPRERGVDGAVLGPEAFVLRYFGDGPELDRLLLVNLGADLDLRPMPEPLLAPPAGHGWEVAWTSEEPRYGGGGVPPLLQEQALLLPGHSAMVLAPASV
ncbi:MAG: malto-oligosyltrehalose trehalohydrolase [Gemmataceae bacterium]